MAFEESLRAVSLLADASVAGYTGVPGLPGSAQPNSGNQYTFVVVTDTNTVGLATSGSDLAIGVLQNKPQVTGQAATVAIRGISKVVSSGDVTVGAPVTADSDGRAVDATSGDRAHGIALKGSSTAGELISVLLMATTV